MLRIIVEVEPVSDKLSAVSDYFDDSYELTWFDSQLAKDIVKGIDLSEYIGEECIKSPILGMIPPVRLSSGCKGCLVLLNEPEHIVSGERFGDNCFEWLSKIGEQQDITVTLHHFISKEDIQLEAFVVNTGVYVHNAYDLNTEVLKAGGVL